MTDALTRDARHAQPVPVDLGGIQTTHGDPETPEHLLSTAVAETAAAVTGVHHLGGALSRSLDRASRRILGSSTVPGVTVSQADGSTVIDLDLVVEYPHTITEVAESVRSQVLRAAAQLRSEPVEVNVNVTDVHGPFDRVSPPNEQIDPADSVAARASAAADDVRSRVADTASTTAAALSGAASTAAGAVSSATDTVRERAADVVQAAGDAVSDATREREKEPVVVEAAGSPADAPNSGSGSVSGGTLADAAHTTETPTTVYVVPVIVEVEPTDIEPASDASIDAATGTAPAEPTDEHRS